MPSYSFTIQTQEKNAIEVEMHQTKKKPFQKQKTFRAFFNCVCVCDVLLVKAKHYEMNGTWSERCINEATNREKKSLPKITTAKNMRVVWFGTILQCVTAPNAETSQLR